ncbi:hypothetical protein O181_076666 [Austropuccinia psidii MF-1]|uniref:Glycosyl transferase CAP10 domain-containing protein n=1 Tax=Austropuccinia psidii MF-1 TaxID=1389203 RepID=A0A9Q3IBC8_9BASI|nr:hypothetical protein [Austropuccinia psidii MF-1]
MSSSSSSIQSYHDYLGDCQEKPLLGHHSNTVTHSKRFKLKNFLRSRAINWLLTVLFICLIIFIDRNYFRNLNDPHLIWDTNYHLTNAIASHLCNLLPSQQNQNILTSSLCLKKVLQHKALQSSHLSGNIPETGITMDRQMDSERCQNIFPNLYKELHRAVDYYSNRNITWDDLNKAAQHSHARVLIYRNRVYIKSFKLRPKSRAEAILNSIQEAVITSPELLPDVEFAINTEDASRSPGPEPLWVLDRSKSQKDVWLMPDFGFYSWPEPKVGGMIEVRDNTAQRESNLKWNQKIPKAFWRGVPLVKVREQLLEIAKGQSWSDIAPLDWQNTIGRFKAPDEHCDYKYLIHTEGYAYSGRLKYLQMCRSVVIAHKLEYIQHFHHFLDSRPYSPTQNIAIVEGPGFEGLPKLIDQLKQNDQWAEKLANNSYSLFRHYLSPAAVNCYWRQMFKSWAQVQGFVPQHTKSDTPFESFNLMHATEWSAH